MPLQPLPDSRPERLTRRHLTKLAAALSASPLLLAFDHDPTHPVSEGPAYKPGAPVRSELIAPGTPGSRFLLRGKVFSTSDKPVHQAMIEVWSVQNNGLYDFSGFNLRGRQLAGKDGSFQFMTVEAIPYGGRTAHFHFKVSSPGYQPLTTELYLPGITQNVRDSSFRDSNLLRIGDDAGIRQGLYDFYLRPG